VIAAIAGECDPLTLRYLAPGVDRDALPRWSPDSAKIAFNSPPGCGARPAHDPGASASMGDLGGGRGHWQRAPDLARHQRCKRNGAGYGVAGQAISAP